MTSSIFNSSNVNRLEVMIETIKTYENTINTLNELLKQKEKVEAEVFNSVVRSDTSLDYFLQMIKKDTLTFEIKQLKAIIKCQNRDLEQEKEYLRNAIYHSQNNKKRKLDENNHELPQPSMTDLYMN